VKITFLIRALNVGGAQSQMVLLARELRKREHDVSVIAFYDGVHTQTLRAADVTVHLLNKRGRWDVFGFLWRLVRLVRSQKPDVLYGYLPLCNLLTSFLRLFSRKTRCVWGVRTANLKLEYYDWLARSLSFIEMRLASLASLVIVNSHAGRRHLLAEGVTEEKIAVIPNGIDIDYFHPDRRARAQTRAQWNVADDEILIGIVGRLDPIKEHRVFLTAAHQFRQVCPPARFVCVGGSARPDYRESLDELSAALDLQERVIWTGAQYDMLGVYNALDILTNASSSEGFSNVIGEAMSCGTPCVVTDVGDSALIVGATGVVVPANDATALREGWVKCLRQYGQEVVPLARQRIRENFSAEAFVVRTEAVLKAIV
jgi:glycosyltransferase involved in cell wall biosynthesis